MLLDTVTDIFFTDYWAGWLYVIYMYCIYYGRHLLSNQCIWAFGGLVKLRDRAGRHSPGIAK